MTNVSVLSDSAAVAFLEWLDPTGLHNLVAIDPVTKAVEAATFNFRLCELPNAQEWIRQRNGRMNLYFSINEPADDARPGTKLRRDEIGAVRAFHVDIDSLEGEPDWDMDCMPSAVIDSGGGRWGLWKLAEPIPLGPDWPTVADIEAQNRALTARFHGDTQAHNLDRIARLPGTLNIPNGAKRKKGRVEVASRVVTVGGPVWEPGEVAAWCAPAHNANIVKTREEYNTPLAELDAPASVARAARYLLQEAGEAIEGSGGDAATYAVAARLKDFGVSQQTAFDLLLDCWNADKAIPPWPAAKLLDKVRNAYRHGTVAPGRNSPALAETEFEAVDVGTTDTPKPKSKMQGEDFAAINEDFNTAPTYLIEEWCDLETMIVTYGESNSGKTHVVLDQALAIAAGRPWAGKRTHQGLVVYVAAEGGRGMRRRVMAHQRHRPEHKDLPFSLLPYPINLMHSQADAKALVAFVKAKESQFGQGCVLVVIDTLSRALAGGDENSSADMGAFVKRCDEIRAATGAALHVIHHAGKNTAKGARGHSLLRAAVDTEIEIENGAILCRKQRDMDFAKELRFDYKPVVLGRRPDGRDVVSVVLDAWETSEFDTGRTPQTQKVLDKIMVLITQKTQKTGGSDSPNVTPREIIALGESSTTVERALGELVGEGQIVKCKRGLYKLVHSPIPPSFPQA